DTPEELMRLLLKMARNKLASKARQVCNKAPDSRRVDLNNSSGLRARSSSPTPSQIVAGRNLLREVLQRLTEEERQISELRGQGCSWPEIAREVGGTPEARRKQLT